MGRWVGELSWQTFAHAEYSWINLEILSILSQYNHLKLENQNGFDKIFLEMDLILAFSYFV